MPYILANYNDIKVTVPVYALLVNFCVNTLYIHVDIELLLLNLHILAIMNSKITMIFAHLKVMMTTM